MSKKVKSTIFTAAAVLFWIAVWYIAALRIGKPLLLPTPADTLRTLVDLAREGEFWLVCLESVWRIFLGALAGVVLGAVIALLSYVSPLLKYLFSPILSLVKATPVASFIILFLVWIGKIHIPFYISLMMVVPITASNLLEGLENIDLSLREAARVYGLSFAKRWKLLYRHSLMPYFIAALRSGIALAWKAGIAAEVLCTPSLTIGEKLYDAKLYLETEELFAWTFTVIVISVVLEKVIVYASKLMMGGKRREH